MRTGPRQGGYKISILYPSWLHDPSLHCTVLDLCKQTAKYNEVVNIKIYTYVFNYLLYLYLLKEYTLHIMNI